MLTRGRIQLLIIAVSALLFIPGLGAVHLFDWDEINFAEIAREMVVTGNWAQPQIDYLPFHEKPPLFIWFQALSMKVIGVGEFAARLPNAICGIITLLVLFRIGDQLRNKTFGMLWVLAYVGSILPHLYFRSGIIDPWFNLFIFLGLHAIITLVQCDPSRTAGALNARRDSHAWLAGLFLGLAVLTKGPVGVLIPGLAMFLYWLLRNGPEFMVAFFWRQVAMLTTEDAGHGGFVGYHFVVLLLGCFPASVFALQELFKPTRTTDSDQNDHRRWMVILFWVVLILFSIVKTKIVHYSSLAYFPLTYLAALQLERIWKQERFGWSRFLIAAIGSLIALIFLAAPIIGMNIHLLEPLLAKDPFGQANLQADVHWSGAEIFAGAILLGSLLAGLWLHGKGRYREAVVSIFGGSTLFVTLALFFFINRIEGYSQHAAIEFFKERQGEKCYVITKNYKSYAHLFYTAKPPVTDMRSHNEEWLLYDKIDRPVYVVCKITSAQEVAEIRTLKELYRKNGFVFFKREPN